MQPERGLTSGIRELLDWLADRWNNGDLEAYAGAWAEDADFVDSKGIHLHGREEILDNLRLGRSGFPPGTRVRVLERSTRPLSPDTAVVRVKWGWNGGARRSISILVVQRVDGRWQIIASQNTDTVDAAAFAAYGADRQN